MKKMVRNVAVVLALCTPLQALAGTDTNADLLKACQQMATAPDAVPKDFGESFQNGYCLGMVQGIIYGTSINKRPFCLPDSWNVGQGVDTFVKWANTHADKADEMATVGVMASHILEFPCKK